MNDDTSSNTPTDSSALRLRALLIYLYHESGTAPALFRYTMLVFDILAVVFFVYLSMSDHSSIWFRPTELVIGAVIALDFAARYWIAYNKMRYLLQLTTVADLIVLVTLLLPAFIDNFAFLRILRALRILRSKHVMRDLRSSNRFIRRNEEAITSLVNLIAFIFIMTSIVFELQVRVNPDINNHIDALYYTVTTLTTTGFGDITVKDTAGRLLSVIIMVFGVGLFLRLLQTLFRPSKVHYRCKTCGLTRHEPDASHCKHCGNIVNITTEGE